MFESALLSKLRGDATLATYVSSFVTGGSPVAAIFSEHAPETAELPYITFTISPSSSNSLAVKEFNIYIDYFDYNKSSSNSRKAAERIEFILDRCVLEHARFNYIRLYYYSGDPVVEDDPRAIHYNLQFNARAGRKKWIDEITTTTPGS